MSTVHRLGLKASLCSLFVTLALGLVLAAGSPASAQRLEPVTVAFASSGMNYMPAVIAQAEGFTAKHGLDVTHLYMSGGTPTIQALLAGEFPIAVASTEMIHAALQGFDPVMIAAFTPNMPYHFVTRGDIRSAEDLRGRRAAISAPGAISDGVVRLAITRLGLVPERDVAIIPIGGQTARLAAIEAGTADATVLAPPLSYQLVEQGYNILLDLMAERVPSNQEGVVTTRRMVKERPDLLKAYIKAIGEALHYIHTNREGTLRHIADYLQMDLERERAIIERAYDEFVTYNFPKKPYPLVEGWRNALQIGALQNPAVLELDPWDLMDVSIVRELDEEGFFDALYQ